MNTPPFYINFYDHKDFPQNFYDLHEYFVDKYSFEAATFETLKRIQYETDQWFYYRKSIRKPVRFDGFVIFGISWFYSGEGRMLDSIVDYKDEIEEESNKELLIKIGCYRKLTWLKEKNHWR